MALIATNEDDRMAALAMRAGLDPSWRVQVPFGGFKQSGMGRELGMEGMRGFTEHKSVFISTCESDAMMPHTR